jgi:hypothetical protein
VTTGWNLPPWVSVSDIPGNRPEDEEFDRLCVDEQGGPMRSDDAIFDMHARGVWIVDEHDHETVWTHNRDTGRKRQFERRRLEEVEEGVWQEMEREDR